VQKSSHSNIRIGAVILAGLLIVASAILRVGGGAEMLERRETLKAHFQRANGLQAGAPVILRGVPIGAVDSITFPTDPDASWVVVTMSVEPSAAKRVPVDAVAQIRTIGLLGDKYIEIDGGNPRGPKAHPNSLLRAADPIDLEGLLGGGDTADFVTNVETASSPMRQILEHVNNGNGLLAQLVRGGGENQISMGDLKTTLENINRATAGLKQITEHLNMGHGVAGAMLVDSRSNRRLMEDLSVSMSALRTLTQRLDHLTADADQKHGLFQQLVRDPEFASEVRESSRNLNEILRKINRGEGTLGKVINDPSLYLEATNLARSTKWGLGMLNGVYKVTHPFGGSPTPLIDGANPSSGTDSPTQHQARPEERGSQ
jgi:phospholipid/cholesterol/gamma-HCH transport system substrate-binding protein